MGSGCETATRCQKRGALKGMHQSSTSTGISLSPSETSSEHLMKTATYGKRHWGLFFQFGREFAQTTRKPTFSKEPSPGGSAGSDLRTAAPVPVAVRQRQRFSPRGCTEAPPPAAERRGTSAPGPASSHCPPQPFLSSRVLQQLGRPIGVGAGEGFPPQTPQQPEH